MTKRLAIASERSMGHECYLRDGEVIAPFVGALGMHSKPSKTAGRTGAKAITDKERKGMQQAHKMGAYSTEAHTGDYVRHRMAQPTEAAR